MCHGLGGGVYCKTRLVGVWELLAAVNAAAEPLAPLGFPLHDGLVDSVAGFGRGRLVFTHFHPEQDGTIVPFFSAYLFWGRLS